MTKRTLRVRAVGVVAWTMAAAAFVSSPAAGQSDRSGGDATIYFGTYDKSIYIVDEATFTVTDKISTKANIPTRLTLSQNREHLYVLDERFEQVELVDLAARKSIDSFTLSKGNTTVRIRGLNVDPRERFAVLLVRSYTKLPDRFEIGTNTLVKYDLEKHAVTDTIPWPDDEERESARLLFSPDGDLLYFFADDVLILDTERFNEVDRWELSQPLEEGMGRFRFGFPTNLYEEPGFYTGLFRITDPVQNRRMMGIARVNLAEKDVDFFVLGPSESVSFSLAPDRKKAYGLHQEVGNYQFWTFDLEGRRVASKTKFQGRPRMAIMPSSNGQLLYIYNAGNTIDIYEAATFRHVRQVQLDADMTSVVLLPSSGGP